MLNLDHFIQTTLILEGEFHKKDWCHARSNDYIYAKAMIHDLLNDKPVKLEKGGEITIKDFDKKKIEDLASKLERCPELTSVDDFQDAYIGDQINKRKKTVFCAINKQVYSKKVSNSLGESAESLVCYLYNNGLEKKSIENFSKLSGINFDDLYLKSCLKIVKLINSSWNNNDYEMVHVDGKDYDTNLNKISKYIAMIFKSKSLGQKVLGFNIDDLYNGAKDKWNPADVILIKKTDIEETWLKLQEVAKDGAPGVFGKPLNVVLSTLCNEEKVVPISLKKCIKEPKLFSHCVDNEEAQVFTKTYPSLASKYVQDKTNGSIYLISLTEDNDVCTVQFRTQDSNDNNLSIESYLKSKSARGGKGLTVVKNALKIGKGQDYYEKLSSNEELIKLFKQYGFELKTDTKKIEKINPPLYKRTSCCGLLGILKIYKLWIENQGDTYTPENFALFCWEACCSCPGAYHVVHD
jgi:hypothetical protein